jgi:hypothetical protein
MKIRTCALVAAAVAGTLGSAGRADAQSMTGTAYGVYGRPVAPVPSFTAPAITPPAMYSANWVAPTAGPAGAGRGYNQYTAGSYAPNPYTAGYYSPNPYTAGVPRGPVVFTTPGVGFGSVGGVVATDRFKSAGWGSPTDRFRGATWTTPMAQFGQVGGFRTTNVYGGGFGPRGTVVVPRRIR